MMNWVKRNLINILCACALSISGSALAGDPIPEGWQAHNVEPIGFLDYEDRYSGKLTIKEHAGRWYIYMPVQKTQAGQGPILAPALKIVDVTDPSNPTVVKQIDYPMDGNMAQITSQGDLLMVGLSRELTQYDTQNAINFMAAFQPEEIPDDKLKYEGILLFDISDPESPVELSHWETGATACTEISCTMATLTYRPVRRVTVRRF